WLVALAVTWVLGNVPRLTTAGTRNLGISGTAGLTGARSGQTLHADPDLAHYLTFKRRLNFATGGIRVQRSCPDQTHANPVRAVLEQQLCFGSSGKHLVPTGHTQPPPSVIALDPHGILPSFRQRR